MRFSERVYRILLKAYPRAHLREYGELMRQAFRDQLREAGSSRSKFVRLWVRTFCDWGTAVFTAHSQLVRQPQDRLKAVFFAHYEAVYAAHPQITTEDLLLGVLRADRQFATLLLGATDIRGELGQTPATNLRHHVTSPMPLSEDCKRSLRLADEEAKRSGAARATPRHLIAGILLEQESLAARVLREHGIDLARVRAGY